MIRIIYLLFCVGLLTACSPKVKNSAFINDVSIRFADDSGYRIVGINGQKEVRVESSFVSMVPYVVLEPGRNTIVVEKKEYLEGSAQILPRATFVAEVESGKTYKIVPAESSFGLVEIRQK